MAIRTTIGTSLLLATIALFAGCNGSHSRNPLANESSTARAALTQSLIWQQPEASARKGAFRTDLEGNQYYVDYNVITSFSPNGDFRWKYDASGTRFDGWDIVGDQIRTIESESLNSGSIHRLFIAAIDQQGKVIWRILFAETERGVDTEDLIVSEDGWVYFYYDKYRVTGDYVDEIVAINPEGEIIWNATPTQTLPDEIYFSQHFYSLGLSSSGELIALDSNGVLFLYDQAGSMLASIPSSLSGWNTIQETNNEGVFITSGRGRAYLYPTNYYDIYADLPEYYSNGLYEDVEGGRGSQLMFYNYDFEEVWRVPTKSLLTATAPNGQGGIIVGGYAGELSSYSPHGEELWRFVPDQQLEAQFSWDANGYGRFNGNPETFVGVSSMSVSPMGDVAVSTDSGLLYLVDNAGTLKWSWRGVSGSPIRANGFGISPFDFVYSRGSSGMAWDSVGNLQLSTKLGFRIIDSSTGKLTSGISDPLLHFFEEAPDGSLRIAGGRYVAALEESGGTLWETYLPDNACAQPVVDEALNTYIPTARGGMCKLDSLGNLEWEIELPERIFCTPAVGSDGNVQAVTVDGTLLSITPAGILTWSIEGLNTTSLPAVTCPEGVAVITAENAIAFVGYQGAELWEYACENDFLAPPSISADSIVFAGDSRGVIYAIDPAGIELFKYADSLEINNKVFEGYTQISWPPYPLRDGGVIIEFADFPFYGDVGQSTNLVAIKCLSETGEVLWQVPQQIERGQGWHPFGLSVPGLINGEWVLTGTHNGRIIINSRGVSVPIQLPDEMKWGASQMVSDIAGFFTLDNRSSRPRTLYWSELQFN